MSKDALRTALQAMSDDRTVAATIADGDDTALGDADLSDEERSMLQAAADELAGGEVEGFITFDNGLKKGITLDNGLKKGITLDNGIKRGITLDNGLKNMPGLKGAIGYLDR